MKAKITLIILLTILCVSPVRSVVFVNYYCRTLLSDCPPPNSPQTATTSKNENYNDQYNNIAYLQVKAANNFLTANGNWNLFLAKFEMAEVSPVDYAELNNILNKTVHEIKKAERDFAKLYNVSRQYQVNPTVQDNLKNIDYKMFCSKNNLNPSVMAEVECYLSTGDITGIPNRIREYLTGIKIQIEDFRKSVENREPDIDAMYTLNQSFLTTALFGQYSAMIFREMSF